MKEEKNAPEEAFNAASFAQFVCGPGRRQTGAILWTSGIPRNDGHGSQHAMNPGNETQAPIGCIQTDNVRMDLVKVHGPCQQPLCKRSIVRVGRRKEKEERQAGTTTDEGMHSEASQKRTRMGSGSVT